MFGTNPIRKQVLRPDGALEVQSIFPTLQGEGPLAGRAAVFIRLAGCNLHCWFCDTDFESGIDNLLEVDEIMRKVREACSDPCKHDPRFPSSSNISLAVISGGEPMRQNIAPLCLALLRYGMQVQIETAGTLWVPGLEEAAEYARFSIVCSPKTPKINPTVEKYCTDYKYIVSARMPWDRATGLPLAVTQRRADASELLHPPLFLLDPETRTNRNITVWVQPCDEKAGRAVNRLNENVCLALVMKHGYRLSLQQHKLIEVE